MEIYFCIVCENKKYSFAPRERACANGVGTSEIICQNSLSQIVLREAVLTAGHHKTAKERSFAVLFRKIIYMRHVLPGLVLSTCDRARLRSKRREIVTI